MGPKLAIALPANLPDCAGDSPITQPDADPWMTGRERPEQPVANVHETMGVSLWGTQAFSSLRSRFPTGSAAPTKLPLSFVVHLC